MFEHDLPPVVMHGVSSEQRENGSPKKQLNTRSAKPLPSRSPSSPTTITTSPS